MSADVVRRFAMVNGRRVHYRCVGTGPVALFIHSSPANSSFVLPEMRAIADRFTCFGFDTPGFGLSDPLPGDRLSVADLADATAAAMAALALPACPVFGTHTGAAIALELGVRHPDRVTGLFLDAVPIFTEAESAALFDGYLIALEPDPLGGHFSRYWTRFRDQSIWFPWHQPSPDHLNRYDLAAPERTHDWTTMFYDCGRTYAPAYRAALDYGPRALAAAAALDRPAVFTATPTDMLYPHLDRLPGLKPGQAVRHGDKHVLLRDAFTLFGSAPLKPLMSEDGEPDRQFFETSGGALHLRRLGDDPGHSLVMLHDLPGGGFSLIDAMHRCAVDYRVAVPDLPGSGESALSAEAALTLDRLVECLWQALDLADIAEPVLHGRGFGAAIALAMSAQRPDAVRAVILCGLPLPDDAARLEMGERYAPPITIEADGSHWYRTWQMLRDGLVYFPWYDRRLVAQRGAPADFDGDRLHEHTVQVMKQSSTYHHAIRAVLAQPIGPLLDTVRIPIIAYRDDAVPFSTAYDGRMRTEHPMIEWADAAGEAGLGEALARVR